MLMWIVRMTMNHFSRGISMREWVMEMKTPTETRINRIIWNQCGLSLSLVRIYRKEVCLDISHRSSRMLWLRHSPLGRILLNSRGLSIHQIYLLRFSHLEHQLWNQRNLECSLGKAGRLILEQVEQWGRLDRISQESRSTLNQRSRLG